MKLKPENYKTEKHDYENLLYCLEIDMEYFKMKFFKTHKKRLVKPT